MSALLEVYNNMLFVLSEEFDHVDMIYFDIAKPFDKVDHGLL